ncbi:hypothetical protein OUZ56_012111 [Daphnia magna]|uniref:Uncharacterized protein n=1 Tax=Daphnia magna TaxID=35525 RepID=A0ABQ9Z223_9CRUS|nr:hypothetical protein OUZ56_012111 [Daphnia magna]
MRRELFPPWRNELFVDWCEGAVGRLHGLCKAYRKYFSASTKAFTNFSIHIELNMRTIGTFKRDTKINPFRQATLDRLTTRMLAGIPGYKAATDLTMKRRHLVEEFN